MRWWRCIKTNKTRILVIARVNKPNTFRCKHNQFPLCIQYFSSHISHENIFDYMGCDKVPVLEGKHLFHLSVIKLIVFD